MKSRFTGTERKDILQKSQQCLWTPEGKIGLDYLKRIRLLSDQTIRAFGLGYVPSSVRHQLSGRVIFPIFDASNNLIALSSRLVDGKDCLPIYWHEAYEKDFYLYGMQIAKRSMRHWHFSVVCEGQIDALRMHDQGVTNAVALCGTKFSDIHLSQIYRYCEEIVVILDTDSNKAGQKAANKIENRTLKKAKSCGRLFAHEYGVKINTLIFDENLDPDDYIRKYGMSRLKSLIREKVQEMRNSGY